MKIYIAGTTPGSRESMKREDKTMLTKLKMPRLLTYYEVRGGRSEQHKTFKYIVSLIRKSKDGT